MRGDLRREPFGIGERRGDLVPAVVEQAAEALAQERLVLDDHDPHGSSAISAVPAPWLALDAGETRPGRQPDRSGRGAPSRCAGVGTAHCRRR